MMQQKGRYRGEKEEGASWPCGFTLERKGGWEGKRENLPWVVYRLGYVRIMMLLICTVRLDEHGD